MANKVYNMEGGLHSAAAYSAFENAMYGSCVASATDFVASAGTGMNVSLSAGNGMIDTGQGYSRRIASDATNTIPVTAASSANPRMDAVVAYIDNGVSPTTSVIDNTNNILKFACVAGSPAATPQAPSAATIQSAIGAGNPYVILWYVTIPTSATSLSSATFTDNRAIATKVNGANIVAGSIGTTQLADSSVTSSKVDWTASGGVIKTITDQSGLRTGVYYGDGTMIAYRKVTGTSAVTTATGSLYTADIPETSYWALAPAPGTGAADFIAAPTVTYSIFGTATQYMWVGSAQGAVVNNSGTGNRWSIPTSAIRLYRASSHNAANWEIDIIAIGRWK